MLAVLTTRMEPNYDKSKLSYFNKARLPHYQRADVIFTNKLGQYNLSKSRNN